MSSRSTHPPVSRRERRAAERAERRPASDPARPGSVTAPRSVWRSPLVVLTVAAILVTAVAIGALVLSSQNGDAGPSTAGIMAPPASSAGSYADGEAIGPAGAPVVLEVYSDYQCPWCGKFARETLPVLVSRFVADGNLRIEERTIAFLGTAVPGESLDAASAASCAAREGKHWQFHDYLVWNQDGENQGAFRRERLSGMAELVGLDVAAFQACLDDPAVQGAITTRTEQAFAAGINSTPTFVLDGERVTGLTSYDELSTRIQAKLDALGS